MITNFLNYIRKLTGINVHYYIASGSWVAVEQVLKMLVGLGLSVVFARFLSQETYGTYQLVIAFIGTLAIFSLPDLNTSIFSSVTHGSDGAFRAGYRLRRLWALLGVPVLLVISTYYLFWTEQTTTGLGIFFVALFFPIITTVDIWRILLQAQEKFRTLTLYSIIQTALHGGIMASAIILSNDRLLPIVIAYLVSLSATNGFFIWKSKQFVRNDKQQPDWQSYGMFLTKTNIIAIATSHLDKILVGVFLGPAQLAVYGVGMKFAANAQELLKGLLTTVTPKIAKHNTLDIKKYGIVFLGSVIFAALLVWVTPWIIDFLYTERYADSIYLSQIVLAFLPFFVINNLYNKHFKYYKKDRFILLRSTVIGPIVRAGLIILALPLFGLVGLAFLHGARSVIYIATQYILSRFQPASRD